MAQVSPVLVSVLVLVMLQAPAMKLMMPVLAVISRMAALPVSAMYTLLELSTKTSSGWSRTEPVAGKVSPPRPPKPLPAMVLMMPLVPTLRIELLVAVVVIVSDGHPEVVVEVGTKEPGFPCYIFESSVAFVAEQAVIVRGIHLLQLWQFGTVGEEDIHFAVLIVVEDRDAAAHGLNEILPASEVVVGNVGKPGARSDVGKVNAPGRRVLVLVRKPCNQEAAGQADRAKKKSAEQTSIMPQRILLPLINRPRAAARLAERSTETPNAAQRLPGRPGSK